MADVVDWIIRLLPLFVLVYVIIVGFKRQYCSGCGAKLPRIVNPFGNDYVFGTWVCSNCKRRVDSHGKIIENLEDYSMWKKRKLLYFTLLFGVIVFIFFAVLYFLI